MGALAAENPLPLPLRPMGGCDSLCVAVGVQKKVMASADGGQMLKVCKNSVVGFICSGKGGKWQ
jgi:hypothetical protein